MKTLKHAVNCVVVSVKKRIYWFDNN